MNLKKMSILQMVFLTSTLWVTGCAHQYAPEQSFGESVRTSVVKQSIRVGGVGHDRIEPGLDGQAAKGVMDRYVRSYEQPQPLGSVLRLGIGASQIGPGGAAIGTATPAR